MRTLTVPGNTLCCSEMKRVESNNSKSSTEVAAGGVNVNGHSIKIHFMLGSHVKTIASANCRDPQGMQSIQEMDRNSMHDLESTHKT